MNRCSTCKFYDAPLDKDGARGWYDLFGRCGRIVHPWAMREKAKDMQPDVPRYGVTPEQYKARVNIMMELMLSEPAYVADASDYDATLWCKPDFGCTAWEGKE